MSGSSYDRRKALRAKERLSKRAIELGSGVWATPKFKEVLDSISQPEKPAEVEKAISAASALRSGGKPPKEVIPDTSKPIAPPEPRGEAEGVLDEIVLCDACGLPASIVRPGKWECRNAGCSENVEDGGALYRELEKARNDIADGKTLTHDEAFIEPPKKRRTLWNWLRKLVGR